MGIESQTRTEVVHEHQASTENESEKIIYIK